MKYQDEVNDLRKLMGTHPEDQPKLETKFYIGVEGITVEMIDWPINPYKAMYVMATSCWGSKINKWRETEPKYRFEVVKAVLEHKALPLALEAPQFTFVVEGPSRAAFDQIARTRMGCVFSAKGMRDNNWKGCSFRIPNGVTNNSSSLKAMVKAVKGEYAKMIDGGKASWQAARCILPMNVCYGWTMSINYKSLQDFCAKRLKFCEQEDTCATAWMIRHTLGKKFPLLADYLRPGCDFAQKCQYHEIYSLSEIFGCLFRECGRWPVNAPGIGEDAEAYSAAQFNEACSDRSVIEEQLGIDIPDPSKELPEGWDDLEEGDRGLLSAD